MKRGAMFLLFCLATIGWGLAGCSSDSGNGGGGGGDADGGGGDGGATGGNMPVFTLAWSEYPSWSVFGVADELGLLDGDEGAQGELEKKHGVDIVLKEADYDTCLNMFGSKDCDAVCMTNMDALIVSPSRDAVAVLPTSTSNGADACIVTGQIETVEDLKAHKVYGLEGTVSEYCFVRCLEKMGQQEGDFQFTNQDPGAAAVAMQQKADTHQAIMVWNPFVLQTLNDRPDTKVLFDSTQIRGEIVDMVVAGKDSLAKEGADKCVKCIIEAFYGVNKALEDPENGDEVLVALGKKFSNLGVEDMKKVVVQTEFYKTPADAKALMTGDDFKAVMKTVEDFCVSHKLNEEPSVGFGADAAGVKLRFDASYIE